jgi:hypothetical protein
VLAGICEVGHLSIYGPCCSAQHLLTIEKDCRMVRRLPHRWRSFSPRFNLRYGCGPGPRL